MSQLNPSSSSQGEKPTGGFIILYFFWIGGVSVCSNYTVLNSLDFFKDKFPDKHVDFVFPLPAIVASLVVIFVMTQLSNVFSYSTRIISSMTIEILLCAVVPIFSDVFKDSIFGFCGSLIILFLMGFFNNVCYASIAGFTSQIEGRFTAYFLIGVASFGLLMSFLRLGIFEVFKQLSPDRSVDNGNVLCAMMYYLSTILLIFVSLILHARFVKTDFFAHHETQVCGKEEEAALLETNRKTTPKRDLKILIQVYKEIEIYFYLMLVTCVQHNIAYPALMLMKEIPGMDDQTKSVVLLTYFAVFYIVGKKIAQYRQYYNKSIMITVMIIRFGIVGLIYLQAMTNEIPIVNTTIFGYIVICAFALTMGFTNVGIFILGPEGVSSEKKEVAGFISVFALNTGSVIGGFLSLALTGTGESSN